MVRNWPDEPVDVVVLAGGVNKVSLYEGYEPGYKALIPFHGQTSLRYVLDALRSVPGLGRVCIEGPQQELEAELADLAGQPFAGDKPLEFVEGGESFQQSILIGLRHFRESSAVLFVTADIPLLKPEAIKEFLRNCNGTPSGAAGKFDSRVYVSVVPQPNWIGPFADSTKPFHRFKDIAVSHGNLFLATPDLVDHPTLGDRLDQMYAGRKTLRGTLAMGWKVALTYAFGVEVLHTLTLTGMADYASEELGFGVVPILVNYPEIAIDVDEPADYQLVSECLGEGN